MKSINLIGHYLTIKVGMVGLLCLWLTPSVNQLNAQQPVEQHITKIVDTYRNEDGTTFTKEIKKEDIHKQTDITDLLEAVPEDEAFVSRIVEVTKRYEDGSVIKQKHITTAPNKDYPEIFEGPNNGYGESFGEELPIKEFLRQFSEELRDMDFTIPDFELTVPEFHFDFDGFDLGEGGRSFFEGTFPGFEGSTYLGVQTIPHEGEGVLIKSVVPGSPAEKIGLEVEDILLSIDDEPINSPAELRKKIGEKQGGEEVKVKFLRGGVPLVLFVELASREPFKQRFYNQNEPPFIQKAPGIEDDGIGENQQWPWKKGDRKKNILGISVQELNNYDGLKVTNVEPNSPAEAAGIAVDDVIYKFDKMKVESAAHLKSLLEDKSGETVRIDLRRDNKKKKVQVKLDSKNE